MEWQIQNIRCFFLLHNVYVIESYLLGKDSDAAQTIKYYYVLTIIQPRVYIFFIMFNIIVEADILTKRYFDK